ncbi:hypothetical protein JCM16814_10430 [Desulfobaculum senezii]
MELLPEFVLTKLLAQPSRCEIKCAQWMCTAVMYPSGADVKEWRSGGGRGGRTVEEKKAGNAAEIKGPQRGCGPLETVGADAGRAPSAAARLW